ncbi:electron transfer flavoprotein regulatory factor 1 isoform X3 [Gopherus flavomarginatus]|uniref:electron transfer flavoprotein regulatory factor 1 isoform X3 n=1 Tax=Gopherus flavomarginatus TaxID=286002 RepID=UPI0021CC4B0F|nr:electron transfer flavoprotein regulatory factor 1 isoform X3 [Gopherus flavomarginatus]
MIACERCLTTEESEVLAPQKRCFGSKNIATHTYVVTQQSSLVLETFSFLEVARSNLKQFGEYLHSTGFGSAVNSV